MSVNVRIRNGLCPDPTTGDGGATEGDIRGSFSDIIDVVGVKDLAGGHALVTQNSPAAMSVLVAPGVVYIPNADYDELDSNQVKFWEAVITVSTAVAITANTSGSTRIDLICVKMDTAVTPDEHASNIATLVAVTGTPGAGVPVTPDNYAKLAEVEVANGAATIVNADITDSRVQADINGAYVKKSNGLTFTEIVEPDTPAANKIIVYAKDVGGVSKLFFKQDDGTEVEIGAGGGGILSTTQYAPSGFLINGKIVPSVASNNLTLAIKGMDGNDPSASNPVYVRIGNTVRTITSALSVTLNAGTNYFNSGSAELATKEIDYFVYLGYNSTDGVVIGFSRIPFANIYSDFSATNTNEKFCAISKITNAAAGDDYELIGRFAATLSAGTGYTWTVPTFTNKNLIQRPIYETRWLTYTPVRTVESAGTPPTYTGIDKNLYKIINDTMYLKSTWQNTSGGTAGSGAGGMYNTIPFSYLSSIFNAYYTTLGSGQSYEGSGTICGVTVNSFGAANQIQFLNPTTAAALTANDQSSANRYMVFNASLPI